MSTGEATLLVSTWVCFGWALIWTFGFIMQLSAYIMHAYQDKNFTIPPQYSIMMAVFWSIFGLLMTIIKLKLIGG